MDASTVGILSGLGTLLLGAVSWLVALRVRDRGQGQREGSLETTVLNLEGRVTRLGVASDKSQDALANLSERFGRLETELKGIEVRMGDRLEVIKDEVGKVRALLDQFATRSVA